MGTGDDGRPPVEGTLVGVTRVPGPSLRVCVGVSLARVFEEGSGLSLPKT